MTSAPEAHKTAGVLATVRPLDFANALHHAFEAGKSGIAWPDYDGDSPAVDRINAALYPWLFSTPSVPAVAELLGDGLAQPIASGAASGWMPKVKALEWEHHPQANGQVRASSPIGTYRIVFFGDYALWGCRAESIKLGHKATTIEEAKAAAQADYERRVLAALTASPVGDDPKALDAAARSSSTEAVEQEVEITDEMVTAFYEATEVTREGSILRIKDGLRAALAPSLPRKEEGQ